MALTRSFVLSAIREFHGSAGPPEGHPLHGAPAHDAPWYEANAERILPRVELVARLQKVRRGAGWPAGTDDWLDEAGAMAPAVAERFLADRLNTFMLAVEAADPAIFDGLDEVFETHAYDLTASGGPSTTGLHPAMIEAWVRSEAAAVVRQRRLTGTHGAAPHGGEIVTVDVRADSPEIERWSRTFEPLGSARVRRKKAPYVGFTATPRAVYAGFSTEIVVWSAEGGAESLSKKTGHFTGKIQGLVADGDGVWAYGSKEAIRLVGAEVVRRIPAPEKVKIRRLAVSGDALFIRDEKKLAVLRGDEVVIHRVASGFDLVLTPDGDALLGEQWLAAGETELRPLALPVGWGPVMGAVRVAARQWLVFQGGAVAEWRGEGLGEVRPLGGMPHRVRGAFALEDSLILYGSHLVEWRPAR